MDILIKLPDTDITENIIRAAKWEDGSVFDMVLRSAMKDAVILPKGYGNLIDVNDVEEYLNDIQCELDGWGETESAIEIAKAKLGLDFIVPIIKADKEGE